MPNRIIKESVCTSDSIDQLGWFEEVLFYRLIVNCDDFGRFDGRVAVIKNRLFPLKENLTLKNVESAINKLARVGLIIPYESGGKPFLFLPTWNEHQCVRAKRSKFPEPEIICKQLQADESKCPRNPIQSESNPIRNPNPIARGRAEGDFEKFWEAYPRKEGKQKARAAFEKVTVSLEIILDAIKAQQQSAQWTKDNGQFIPHPATWLNGKRWEDQVKAAGSSRTNGERRLDEDEIASIRRMMEAPDFDDIPQEVF